MCWRVHLKVKTPSKPSVSLLAMLAREENQMKNAEFYVIDLLVSSYDRFFE